MLKSIFFTICLIISLKSSATEVLKVVTTLPDLAAVAKQIGGDKVSAISLLEGTEDPHYLDASPFFIRKVASADLFCLVGMDLEVGWAPKVLSRSANASVQPGGKGYCDVSTMINALEVPTGTIDRSMGDVHAAGNPHYNISPTELVNVAKVIKSKLSDLRPSQEAFFEKNLNNFKKRMASLKKQISKKLAPYAKSPIMVYHKEFSYFFKDYNLKSAGSIENIPGVTPSAKRLAQVSLMAKSNKVKLALAALHSPSKHLEKFSDISSVPYKKVPIMVQPHNKKFDSIAKVQHQIADAIIESLK
jgi:zinc/manganese transport system substrate-binding protein